MALTERVAASIAQTGGAADPLTRRARGRHTAGGYTLGMADSRLVYSTAGGRVRQPAAAPAGQRRPPAGDPPIPRAPDDGWVRLWRVKGGRGGKTATVITGVPGSAAELETLAVALRRFVGAGGGVRDGAIEVQGDHRDRLHKKLAGLGYRVKLAGG